MEQEQIAMIPIPNQIKTLLEDGKKGNFSLYFSRMVTWGIEKDKSGNIVELIKDKKFIENISLASKGYFQTAIDALKNKNTKQKEILENYYNLGLEIFEFHAELLSPFITGLGSGHPNETGMTLDRNTGIPFIPASGIKGVLRLAHALNLKKQDKAKLGIIDDKGNFKEDSNGNAWVVSDRETTLRKYFGDVIKSNTENTEFVRGQLVFLDAYPESISILNPDIMTPHFGSYYKGPVKDKEKDFKGPVETESPVPIKFLTVSPGIKFIFRCFALPLKRTDDPQRKYDHSGEVYRDWNDDDRKAVSDMFKTAFEKLGMGAKTNIGYGRFTNFTDKSELIVDQWKKIAEQKEKDKREEEEKNKKREEDALIKQQKEAEEVRLKAQKEAEKAAKQKRLAEIDAEIAGLVTVPDKKEQKKIDKQRKILELVKLSLEDKPLDLNDIRSVYDSILKNLDLCNIGKLHAEAAGAIFKQLNASKSWEKTNEKTKKTILAIRKKSIS